MQKADNIFCFVVKRFVMGQLEFKDRAESDAVLPPTVFGVGDLC